MRAIALGVLASLAAAPALAELPNRVALQGRLVDGSQPVTGAVTMTVRLYDASSGGTPLASDEDGVVLDASGAFVTTIGDSVSLPAGFFDRPLWAGVEVDGGGEQPGRIPLGPVPYALVAGQVDELPARVFHVGHNGDDDASGQRLAGLLNSLTDGSATSPYVVKVGPGRFVTGSAQVRDGVHLIGSGPDATTIDGQLTLRADNAVQGLRIASATRSLGINNSIGPSVIRDLEIVLTQQTFGQVKGINCQGTSAGSVIEDVRISINNLDTGGAVGIELFGGAGVAIRRVRIELTTNAQFFTSVVGIDNGSQVDGLTLTDVDVLLDAAGPGGRAYMANGTGRSTLRHCRLLAQGSGTTLAGAHANSHDIVLVDTIFEGTATTENSGTVCGLRVLEEDFDPSVEVGACI